MGDFQVDTAVRGEGGRYHATLSKDWEIWGPNGGYLAAIALRAAGREAKIPRPASLYLHFLGVAAFGDVDLDVTVVKAGRRSESLRVAMAQGGRPILEATVRTAAEGPGLEHDVTAFPDVPLPDALEDIEVIAERKGLTDGPRYAFWNNLQARPTHPDRVGPRTEPSPPVFQEWYRYRPRATFDDPWTDAGRYALLVDTLSWPAAARLHPTTDFIAPSLDCMVWFHRAVPEAEWLLADHSGPLARAGLMATEGRVWSAAGELLASGGSQLFCVPPRG